MSESDLMAAFHAGFVAAQKHRTSERSYQECIKGTEWMQKEMREDDENDGEFLIFDYILPFLEHRSLVLQSGWWAASHVRESIETLRFLRQIAPRCKTGKCMACYRIKHAAETKEKKRIAKELAEAKTWR